MLIRKDFSLGFISNAQNLKTLTHVNSEEKKQLRMKFSQRSIFFLTLDNHKIMKQEQTFFLSLHIDITKEIVISISI